jgi:ATP-dependent Clp protease adapter protein ClpS
MNDSEHDIPTGFDEQASRAATAVEEATDIRVKVEERPKDLTKGQRDHVVLLWNDNEHTELFVMAVLMQVCKMTEQEAYKAAMTVHEEGKAPVWRGLLEHCELKRDQISTFRDAWMIENGGPNLPLNVTVVEA